MMEEKNFLPGELLERLKNTYEHFPERKGAGVDEAHFDSSLEEFLDAYGSEKTLLVGETLFFQGDPADGFYWIDEGVLVVLQGNLDRPKLLTFRKPGQVVGEIALLENIKRTATVAAITETRLKVLSNEKFQGVMSLIPGFGVELMRLLSARLREVKPAEYSDGLYDHLTGAMSRQAFDIRLPEEIERAQVYRYNFSLVFLDLDHFKEVNDTHGHARGDEVLTEFVRRVMAGLRTTDLLFRYGGDEFVLLLQGIDETRGPALIQHLLDELTDTLMPGDPPLTIGFSAGIAYFPADGESPEALLEIADERVYHAKRGGRGRIAGRSSGTRNER
jgi:diguanylate cyclase (GGDEF)-like protein